MSTTDPTARPRPRLRSSKLIQGNILAGFNKSKQAFLFISFGGDRRRGRAWLNDMLDPERNPPNPGPSAIATTNEVAAHNDEYRTARRAGVALPQALPQATWVNLSLTCSGLLTLAPEVEADLKGYPAFRHGPAGLRPELAMTTAQLLGDIGESRPARWVVGGPGQAQVDALVTVAADDSDALHQKVQEQLVIGDRIHVEPVQYGSNLPPPKEGCEHFGFKDAVSQPGIAGFSWPNAAGNEDADHPGSRLVPAGEFILGRTRADTVQRPDRPRTPAAWMRSGSFQVFRRLTQDVRGWKDQLGTIRAGLPNDLPHDEKALAAKALGRWPNGAPLALTPEREEAVPEGLGLNQFDYRGDAEGHATPRFAHIRRLHPRDPARDAGRRILRRGIPFGPPYDPAVPPDRDPERGLLFNAFMADIQDQFEFLQTVWANNPDHPEKDDGPDPLIGREGAPCQLRRADDLPDVPLQFRRFVRTTGAVYAFAPSLTTLRRLANGDRLGGG
jgi:Dyp-type peroxidase family